MYIWEPFFLKEAQVCLSSHSCVCLCILLFSKYWEYHVFQHIWIRSFLLFSQGREREEKMWTVQYSVIIVSSGSLHRWVKCERSKNVSWRATNWMKLGTEQCGACCWESMARSQYVISWSTSNISVLRRMKSSSGKGGGLRVKRSQMTL